MPRTRKETEENVFEEAGIPEEAVRAIDEEAVDTLSVEEMPAEDAQMAEEAVEDAIPEHVSGRGLSSEGLPEGEGEVIDLTGLIEPGEEPEAEEAMEVPEIPAEERREMEETPRRTIVVDPRSRVIEAATHRQRVAMYGAESIRTIDRDRPGFETDAEREERLAREVALAAHSYSRTKHTGRAMRGTIATVSRVNIGGETEPCADVYHGRTKILIPLRLLTRLGVERAGSRAERDRYNNLLVNERIGSEVDFYVMSFDEANRTAVGNRIEVLDNIRAANFRGRNAIKTGDLIEGRITYVSNTHVGVEAFGVEASLHMRDSVWLHVPSLRPYFTPGQRVAVRVLSASDNGENVKLSIKEASENPMLSYIGHVYPGMKCTGEVQQVLNRGSFVKIDNMELECWCPPPKDIMMPPVGANVLVAIRKVIDDPDDPQVIAYIVREL